MARSREDVRQNKAMQSILRGETPEKRIFVAMEDTKEKKERQKQIAKEKEESSERSEALKAARTPWFCPTCDKVMKKRLDDKMYRLYNHCFNFIAPYIIFSKCCIMNMAGVCKIINTIGLRTI